MPVTRGKIAELLAPGLNLMTFGKYNQFPEEFSRIMNVKTSKRAYEEDSRLSGLGPLAPKGELETVILDEPLKLGLVRYIHETFALGIAFSQESRDDDQHGVIASLAGELGVSSKYTVELYGHDVYNMGFVTTRYVGRDGKALFALDHPIIGTGGVQANMPAVAVDLSEASLEAAIQNFENQVNDRGMPIQLIPRYLVVSPDNRLNARRLLESTLLPGGNNNDKNVLINEGISTIVSHYLTDKDAWFLIAEPSQLDLNFYWREMPDTKTWDDDNADATFHKIRQRHSVGFSEWRGTYGSPGA